MSEDLKLIIIDNKRCQFICPDPTIFKKLYNHLSFKIQGVEWTAAYQNGWNGITYLMNKKGFFASGLVFKVREFLIANDCKFEEQDLRIPITNNISIDLSNKLQQLNMVPRDYQEEIVEACYAHRKGIVRACTGGGKTVCTALLTAKLNKPAIVYVIGLDLLKQFHDLFSSLFDEPIGFIGNGVCNIHRINIVSIWTAGKALKIDKKNLIFDEESSENEIYNESQSDQIIKMLQQTKVHIFDECHVITTSTIDAIYKTIDPEYIYGFSGTPFRDDGSDLLSHGILGEQIINVSASRLIKVGWLAQPIIKFVRVPKTYVGTGTNNYQTVYKEYITENDLRNNLIVENAKELLTKNYQVLILFKHLQHGKNLCQLLDSQEIKYEYLSGADSLEIRSEVKERLLNKESNLILASTVYDIGVDCKTLSALVLAGPTKSSIRCLQRCGRILRPNDGKKKYAAIVDFYDDIKYLRNHSRIRHKIYKSEEGFKIINSAEMNKLLK